MTIQKILRKNQTPWELKLWGFLRGKRLNGLKFKRQVPIGKFVVDFCCDEKKLVIELDGSHHDESETRILDQNKENYLKAENYTVLRFWNNEIDGNIEGVIEKIIITTSLPTSPHAWGEE